MDELTCADLSRKGRAIAGPLATAWPAGPSRCLNCGEPFTPLQRLEGWKSCSDLCRDPFREIDYRGCIVCRGLFVGRTADKGRRKTCSSGCAAKHRRELSNARKRNREHLERSAYSDITPAQEMEMRRKARKCPMPGCGVRLTDKPGLPNSKHLDHIAPLNPTVGGTHTHGNVRIICARCNLTRPKDGSDYTGQLTLWAQGQVQVGRTRQRTMCRNGLHRWVPENIETYADGKKRCKECRRANDRLRGRLADPRECKCGTMYRAPGNTLMCPECVLAAVRQALTLRMADDLTWDEAARQVGYGSGWGIRFAAKRAGYVPPPRPVAAPKPEQLCQCGAAAWRHGRCRDCIASLAVAMYADGETLTQIGKRLGYSSKTGVSNLIKSVSDIRMRAGRPRRRTAVLGTDALGAVDEAIPQSMPDLDMPVGVSWPKADGATLF